MLKSLQIQDVKVQEVFSLDDEMLQFLPKPVFGLIFLFQFQEDTTLPQEQTCPDHVWFANQTTSNACASIALLNIIMNASISDIGPVLTEFKNYSMPLTPAVRGLAVSNHETIRQTHNSFSRKMDILNADLSLAQDARRKGKGSAKKSKGDEAPQAGFHFVAYLPINGSVWKLDGLERQPVEIGPCTDENWLEIARPLIEGRMMQYEDEQLQFTLLALCKSPISSLRSQLAANVLDIALVRKHLNEVNPQWELYVASEELAKDKLVYGEDAALGLTTAELHNAPVSAEAHSAIQACLRKDKSCEKLLDLWKGLAKSQIQLKSQYMEEKTSVQQEEDEAATRRHDYTPLVNNWLAALADNGVLEQLITRL
jgi:ubiquitin carboxyl-terminal hydrolase L5